MRLILDVVAVVEIEEEEVAENDAVAMIEEDMMAPEIVIRKEAMKGMITKRLLTKNTTREAETST